MSDQRILELVWENGQLEARGLPKRRQKSPSCNNGRQYGGDTPKRPKFETSDSAVDDFNCNSALRNVYESHFDEYFSEHKLLKDTQVVPVHETAPTGNSQLFAHQFSLQQQHQEVSAPLKSPREIFPKLKKLGNHLDLEPERRKELVNFSPFLRSAVVPVCSRAEKLQNKQVLGPAAYGSKSVIQTQLNSVEINEDLLPPDANKSVPDVQSKAVNGQTSSLPFANTPAKENLDARKKCKEPPVPSSSFCSLGASNNPTYNTFKTRYEDTKGSTCPSDHSEEKPARKTMHRGSKSSNKKRAPEAHNLSEGRRRDKINKKMRALQELIPNCNKVDRASMLDEAIEYLKTLQFQVKMMSMGTGVCMSPMMLPYGMHQMHAPQLSHFSPMGIGRQMGVGWNPPQFLMPSIARATAVPGIFPETRIPVPGFPGQLLPMSMLSASLGLMHKTIPVAGSMELMDSAPLTNSKDSVQNTVEVNKRYVDRSKIQRFL